MSNQRLTQIAERLEELKQAWSDLTTDCEEYTPEVIAKMDAIGGEYDSLVREASWLKI